MTKERKKLPNPVEKSSLYPCIAFRSRQCLKFGVAAPAQRVAIHVGGSFPAAVAHSSRRRSSKVQAKIPDISPENQRTEGRAFFFFRHDSRGKKFETPICRTVEQGCPVSRSIRYPVQCFFPLLFRSSSRRISLLNNSASDRWLKSDGAADWYREEGFGGAKDGDERLTSRASEALRHFTEEARVHICGMSTSSRD